MLNPFVIAVIITPKARAPAETSAIVISPLSPCFWLIIKIISVVEGSIAFVILGIYFYSFF